MLYSEKIKLAAKICFDAHKDDVDKSGYPYVMHPIHLAEQMDDEDSTIVALLHDVVEDHGDKYSLEYLSSCFSNNIIKSIILLTHKEEVPYMEYVKEIKKDETARKVKIVDLKHNLDVSRLGGNKPYKYDTYKEALEYLEK